MEISGASRGLFEVKIHGEDVVVEKESLLRVVIKKS
jgi:hypothetical protein